MLPETEKYQISLEKAKKSLQTADHITYVTFPLIKEHRLLLKVLEELGISLLNIVNAILQYEYLYRKIPIYQDSASNFNTFKNLASKYNISQEQLNKIMEILKLAERHKKSSFEFMKHNKIVIMSQSMETEVITLEKIKDYLTEVKDIIRKAFNNISGRKI